MTTEFKRNLLKKEKKSTFRIVLGIFFLVISFFWMADRMMDHLVIRTFDWIYTLIFALNGIVHTVEGLGGSIAGLFGKAFILIDHEQISIKPGMMDKAQIVHWKEVKAIDYKLSTFRIEHLDSTTITLKVSKLDYASIKEIKEIVAAIAKDKNIPSNIL